MEKKTFINWAVVAIFVIGYPIIIVLFSLVFFPLLHSPPWIVWGTLILGPLVTFIAITLVSPLFLIIHGDTATFIGIPWVFRIRRDKLADVVFENYRILFLPNNPGDYRWVYKLKEGTDMDGHKMIGFANLKAIGALIDLLQPPPSKMIIHWEFLNEKAKRYFARKLEEMEILEEKRNGNF